MKFRVITMLCLILSSYGFAQTNSETIRKEMAFEKVGTNNTIMVANIFGSIKVEAYDGNLVMLEVVKSINAKTETRLNQGKSEIDLGLMNRVDTLIFYVIDPCHHFGKNTGKNGQWDNKPYSYQWNRNDKENCDMAYDYKMDFVLKVPKSVNLILSTVNSGNISVEGVSGVVYANNVNGSISLTQIYKKTIASTINGNVDIEYASNPENDCKFYSLNGDINALFQQGLAANMSFESFNGDLYTNINQIETLPASVQKISNEEGLKYKLKGNQYKIGGGGANLDFETFNGNVYLKEKVKN